MLHDEFEVTVDRAWTGDYEAWEIIIRRGSAGNVIQPFIRSREKAERMAAALYKLLLPEFEFEAARHRRLMEEHQAELVSRPKPKPFRPTKKMPRIIAAKCGECEELYEAGADEGEAVYECSRCGQTQVEERRCEQCNIFMAKVADESCPHCESPIEEKVETVLAVRSPDGQLHEVDA
jgi:hypothetical protein